MVTEILVLDLPLLLRRIIWSFFVNDFFLGQEVVAGSAAAVVDYKSVDEMVVTSGT